MCDHKTKMRLLFLLDNSRQFKGLSYNEFPDSNIMPLIQTNNLGARGILIKHGGLFGGFGCDLIHIKVSPKGPERSPNDLKVPNYKGLYSKNRPIGVKWLRTKFFEKFKMIHQLLYNRQLCVKFHSYK